MWATKDKKSRRTAILALSIVLSACSGYSQEEKIFVINPGQKVSDVVLPADMYRYPAFKPGTVLFKDGSESGAALNYNLLLNEIQFIDPKGDTLSLANENLIKFVRIEQDSFFYNKGCYELINSFNYTRLARKQTIYMASADKIGAYGQPVQGAAASTYTSLNIAGRSVNLIVNEKVTLKKEVGYYLEDQDGRMMPASRKNLEKLFPKYSAAIEEYTKKSSLDFKRGSDVEKIFEYIQHLKL